MVLGAPLHDMKNFVIAPAVAALAMFLWGFVYYGISGLPYRALQPSDALAPALAKLPASGTYIVPDPRAGNDPAEYKGPFALLSYNATPRPMGATMALGYLHGFACCLILSLLLWRVGTRLGTFACKFGFCFLAGLLVTLFSKGGDYVWWHASGAWTFAEMAYDITAFLLAGLILIKLVTPKPD